MFAFHLDFKTDPSEQTLVPVFKGFRSPNSIRLRGMCLRQMDSQNVFPCAKNLKENGMKRRFSIFTINIKIYYLRWSPESNGLKKVTFKKYEPGIGCQKNKMALNLMTMLRWNNWLLVSVTSKYLFIIVCSSMSASPTTPDQSWSSSCWPGSGVWSYPSCWSRCRVARPTLSCSPSWRKCSGKAYSRRPRPLAPGSSLGGPTQVIVYLWLLTRHVVIHSKLFNFAPRFVAIRFS